MSFDRKCGKKSVYSSADWLKSERVSTFTVPNRRFPLRLVMGSLPGTLALSLNSSRRGGGRRSATSAVIDGQNG